MRVTLRDLSSCVAVVLLFAGCGPGTSSGVHPPGGDAGAPQLLSIAVQPANPTIAVENGASTPVTFTAVGSFADGHQETLTDATFSLDPKASALGSLSGAQLSASGLAAGSGQVIAQSGGVSGSTSVTVTVHTVHVDPSAPGDAPTKFSGMPMMGGALSPQIDYPLDGAVMPNSVKAPDVQWEGTAQGGDLLRVKLASGGATVEQIIAFSAGFQDEWQPPAADWSLLLASSAGQPIAVTVDHYDPQSGLQGSQAVSVHPVTADVTGVIYYWDLSEGKMQRIDASGRALAIPNPPPSPSDAGNHCVACHTISRDGRYLAAELWGGSDSGAVFDLSSSSISASPAPTLAPLNSYISLFSTFNPDASRLIVNSGNALGLIDPKTGMSISTTLPTAKAAHPTWSPDGTLVAFINNTNGPWAVDYTQGDVAVIPATTADTFGAVQTLVSNSTGDAAFAAPSWPSFTPDSQWIAYGAGTNSRSAATDANTKVVTYYPGALFLVNRAGGAPAQLDAACASQRDCYLPSFSPYDSGGYFWLVFHSQRDYGNAQAGTKGTKRRQLWVTAIDKSKLGSGDPSAVPYWLPDQDPKTENMSAFWALPPPLQ